MNSKLADVLVHVLGVDPGSLTEESTPENTPGWDSLKNIFLISAVEQAFEIRFSNADFNRKPSVASFQAVLAKHGVA